MSYFSATMKVNQEGDVLISDDTIHGLGTAQRFLRFLFGSLFLVAHTPPYKPLAQEHHASLNVGSSSNSALAFPGTLPPRSDDEKTKSSVEEIRAGIIESLGTMLIACVPNPGYFVAGGLAGIVSRTSTAPLDRLKVYLIAQTSVAEEAVIAAKHGNILRAVMNAWRPLATATKELWQAGGMRSLYAGRYF
jgi:solute carrier family 25 phosphate transporter 23/24/25/41